MEGEEAVSCLHVCMQVLKKSRRAKSVRHNPIEPKETDLKRDKHAGITGYIVDYAVTFSGCCLDIHSAIDLVLEVPALAVVAVD